MMTQAAAAAGGGAPAAANGVHAASAALKKEVSPVPDGKGGTAGVQGSRAGTPGVATDARQGSQPASPAAAGATASAQGTPEAGAAAGAADGAAPPQEDEETRRLEDEILREGQAIAGVRALLARAFIRPAEEPAVPLGHWSYLLQETQWLANDMAQERLWKQAAALAVAYEVAKMGGKFGLRPPPEGQRQYHDEIVALRTAAAREVAEKTGGRRSAIKAAAEANVVAALKLDPADDPAFRDLESYDLNLASLQQQQPGTPPAGDFGAAVSLVFRHDDAFQEALTRRLMHSEVERMMREEMTAREYRFEYEAALASHHMAVQEQNRRAMRLDADMAEGLAPMDEDLADDEDYAGKKAKNRKRKAGGGFLLDDFGGLGAAAAEETESMGTAAPKQKAASRQYIEDTYLQRKRRRDRYKDVDVDYDVGMETAGRYGTRANRALATRAGATRAQDPNKRKQQQMGRTDSFAAVPGGGLPRGSTRMPPGTLPGAVIWTKAEDDLLLAIAHEFGLNWTMVSEVLSLSLSMQGIFRPPHLCRQRFRQITTPMLQKQAAAQTGVEAPQIDYSEEKALMVVLMEMPKQTARELLMRSLPVHDDVMMRMLEALVQVGATAKQRRQMEERRNEAVRRTQQEPHPSHAAMRAAIMAKTGNKHLTPMELAQQVDIAYAQQAKQNQMLQQQAAQAAQMQAQQASAAPPPAQQQAGSMPPGGPPGAQPGGPASLQPPGGAPAPVQGMPAPAQGPGIAAGTPAGAQALPPMAAPQQQQQQQQQAVQGIPSSATPPLPVGVGPPQAPQAGAPQQQQAQGMPAAAQPGAALPSPSGMPGHAAAPRPAHQVQLHVHQLNQILETGKLPNGTVLDANQLKQIENKRNAYLQMQAQMQQQRQMQMQMQMQQQQQQQQQAAAGVAPGQPSAATQAALQAAQQAAAVQAGMRPAMAMQGMFRPAMPGMPPGGAMGQPAGMPGQPGMPGMPMQPALLQQQMAQMAAAGGPPGSVGMQPLQPGMQLPAAAQQQLIAQQFAMQQQAAAATAAQQQAAAAAAAQQQAGAQQP